MGATKSALCLADAILEYARRQLSFLIQNTPQSKLSFGNHRIFAFELYDVYALFPWGVLYLARFAPPSLAISNPAMIIFSNPQ
jgi:hypothetical protein